MVNMGPNKKPPKKRKRRRKPNAGGPVKRGGGGTPPPRRPPVPKKPKQPGPRAPSAGQRDTLIVPDDTQQIDQMPQDYPEDESVFSSGEGTPPQYHYHREASPGQVYVEAQSEPASGPGQAGQTG